MPKKSVRRESATMISEIPLGESSGSRGTLMSKLDDVSKDDFSVAILSTFPNNAIPFSAVAGNQFRTRQL
jgi:hypothetical protein